MKYCPKCRENKSDASAFCDKCGERLLETRPIPSDGVGYDAAENAAAAPRQAKRKKKRILIAVIVLLAVGGAIGGTFAGISYFTYQKDVRESQEYRREHTPLGNEINSCLYYITDEIELLNVNDQDGLAAQKEKLQTMFGEMRKRLNQYDCGRHDYEEEKQKAIKELDSIWGDIEKLRYVPENETDSFTQSSNELSLSFIDVSLVLLEGYLDGSIIHDDTIIPADELFPDLAADPG